jgi:hypothetical protein
MTAGTGSQTLASTATGCAVVTGWWLQGRLLGWMAQRLPICTTQ